MHYLGQNRDQLAQGWALDAFLKLVCLSLFSLSTGPQEASSFSSGLDHVPAFGRCGNIEIVTQYMVNYAKEPLKCRLLDF